MYDRTAVMERKDLYLADAGALIDLFIKDVLDDLGKRYGEVERRS